MGVGRFLLPPLLLGAAVRLVAGRERGSGRVTLGVGLALVAGAGLADLAGGDPGLAAPARQLAGAGGWVGTLVGGPLRAGLAGWGAAVVLVALAVVAVVVLTGVTLRQAAAAVVAAAAGIGRGVQRWRTDVAAEAATGRPSSSRSAAGPARAGLGGEGADVVRSSAAPPPETDDLAGRPEPGTHGSDGAGEGAGLEPGALAQLDGAGGPVEPDPDPPGEPTERGLGVGEPAGGGVEAVAGAAPAGGDWRLPPLSLLRRSTHQPYDEGDVVAAGRSLVAALGAHGVETRLVGWTVGPTVTRFELELGAGVKVARVTSLAKDIAYAMASPDVRILAPIPGKSAIGVEVPNRRRELVTLGDVLASEEARRAEQPLAVALGRDIAGRPVMVDLATMPHLLISGATGAGKSSCINSIITSLLMRTTPDQVRLILVDPKRVELGQYNGLPHLLTEVVVDPKKAANALSWAVKEMERRYDLLAEVGMRDITGYNAAVDRGELDDVVEEDAASEPGAADTVTELPTGAGDSAAPELEARSAADGADHRAEDSATGAPTAADRARAAARVAESRRAVDRPVRYPRLPLVLVVVDELADLMMVAARDIEESVCRIAQMARAVGIHLVLATQRPSVDVITGVIKANVPSRLAFAVSSLADSRVILDQPGAERLVGKGDMLLLTASSSVPRRIQGPWVSEEEVRAVAAAWRRQRGPQYVDGVAGSAEPGGSGGADDDTDELLDAAMDLVVRSQLGSTSMLQRKLRVGFARAGRLMDLLERRGVVGPSEGSKARAVLMTPQELDELRNR
jgi:S-DNA-T family DNA segregation ATPase FtsK/SpoIIIE